MKGVKVLRFNAIRPLITLALKSSVRADEVKSLELVELGVLVDGKILIPLHNINDIVLEEPVTKK